jgi:hypothetical protein
MAVAIEGLRAEEDLQIPQKMSDHEQKKDTTRNGHDVFFAQRRTKDVRDHIH